MSALQSSIGYGASAWRVNLIYQHMFQKTVRIGRMKENEMKKRGTHCQREVENAKNTYEIRRKEKRTHHSMPTPRAIAGLACISRDMVRKGSRKMIYGWITLHFMLLKYLVRGMSDYFWRYLLAGARSCPMMSARTRRKKKTICRVPLASNSAGGTPGRHRIGCTSLRYMG